MRTRAEIDAEPRTGQFVVERVCAECDWFSAGVAYIQNHAPIVIWVRPEPVSDPMYSRRCRGPFFEVVMDEFTKKIRRDCGIRGNFSRTWVCANIGHLIE